VHTIVENTIEKIWSIIKLGCPEIFTVRISDYEMLILFLKSEVVYKKLVIRRCD